MEHTSSKTQFIVLVGEFDGSPEEVSVEGVFPTLEAAQKFAREEYLAIHYMDEGDEEMNPDLGFTDFLDDGHAFWKIVAV